jgi:hypothetical protein
VAPQQEVTAVSNPVSSMIGGPLCRQPAPPGLIDPEDQILSAVGREALWQIFVKIGRFWRNIEEDSAGLRSSWLEFIQAKTREPPSYAGEYANAVSVVGELVALYGKSAYPLLFLRNGIPPGPPTTRLAHAKQYVVDEFIRVQIVASGFRGFDQPTSLNYNGFIRGSRFNERSVARLYQKPGAKPGGRQAP